MKVSVLGYGTVGKGVCDMIEMTPGLELGPVLVLPSAIPIVLSKTLSALSFTFSSEELSDANTFWGMVLNIIHTASNPAIIRLFTKSLLIF